MPSSGWGFVSVPKHQPVLLLLRQKVTGLWGPPWAGHMPRAGSLVPPLLREMESSLTSSSCTFLASRASGVSAGWDPGSPLKGGHLLQCLGPNESSPSFATIHSGREGCPHPTGSPDPEAQAQPLTHLPGKGPLRSPLFSVGEPIEMCPPWLLGASVGKPTQTMERRREDR